MRALLKMVVMAAVISFSATKPQAAPISAAAQQDRTMFELVQNGYFDENYRAACPSGQHFSCWYEPYGFRFCGCWPGGDRPACPLDYHYACRYGPNGSMNCACY